MGGSAFSEPETKAMSDYYTTIASRSVFFLSIHSYSQLVLLPYGYAADRYADYQEYVRQELEVKIAKVVIKLIAFALKLDENWTSWSKCTC
jgi:hypothetical protein